MKASSMDRLLDAERAAERRVKEAREGASRLIEKAREDMRNFRERSIVSARESGKNDLDAAGKAAEAESERLRNEGVKVAGETLEKGRDLVPAAVDAVIDIYVKG